MLIGIDASRAARRQRTGTETYAVELIRQLLALDGPHRYRLYLQQPPSTGLFDSQAEARVIRLPRLWTHLGLSAEMVRRPPDVLFVPAHVLPLAHPIRSVVTIHDLGHRYFPEAHTAAQRAYLEWSTRFAVRHASRLIAVSRATKDDLVKLYEAGEERVTVVHHGITMGRGMADDERPSSAASVTKDEGQTTEDGGRKTEDGGPRARFKLPERYVLSIGTVQPRKNYARLIEAFASLGLPRREFALVIAGRIGWRSAAIEAQASRTGAILTGYLPDAEKAALLGGAAAFALPSLYEGFGMPILEAQVAGVPVLTSTTTSCPEVAGEGALLVDPLDTKSIAGALRLLLEDVPLRRSLVQKGYANLRRFSWEKCARETLGVLLEA